MKFAKLSILLLCGSCISTVSWAGSIFLTGHDPDFHALLGANSIGAEDINKAAINYITDPAFNPYATGATKKFLFVESSIVAPSGHVDGVGGIIASGYTAGVDFEKHDASDLNAQLNLLGTKYDGIVVASDFGGILTQAELNILNGRSADIITFINNGGGLYAMAESDSGSQLTPTDGFFKFLPFVVTAAALNQTESGFIVTPFGASLGLKNTDINGNASHNIFTATGGLNVVDTDAQGNILSIATRSQVTTTGVAPEPSTVVVLGSALGVLYMSRRRTRRRRPHLADQ